MKPAPTVSDVRALPSVAPAAEALAEALAVHERVRRQALEVDDKIQAAVAQLQPAASSPRARLEAAAANLLASGVDPMDASADRASEEARRGLDGLYRRRSLLTEAVRQAEKLVTAGQTKLDEAVCAAEEVIGPLRALQRAKLAALAEAARIEAAEVGYLDALAAQGVGTSALPDLSCRWLGDLGRHGQDRGGFVTDVLVRGIEMGVIEPADLPPYAHPYIGEKGAALRAERAPTTAPLPKKRRAG